jgi:hypothetical protein
LRCLCNKTGTFAVKIIMTGKSINIILLLLACSPAFCQSATPDTSSGQINAATAAADSAKHAIIPAVAATGVRMDTAVVRRFCGVPVFYHCQPLHRYTTVRIMGRTSLVNYSSQAFEKYAKAARKRVKGKIAIVIDDLKWGTDSFSIVQFAAADTMVDTAVFATPIFLSARPTKAYKVVRVLNDEVAYGSLNANLQRYLSDAGSLHIPYDGIMVRDVSYTFGRDQIYVFRWKKQHEAQALHACVAMIVSACAP